MQFGKALTQVLTKIAHADACHRPLRLFKVDIADGFYKIHLAVAFPSGLDGTLLVAFPLVLPMGGVKSPPYLSLATEMIADLTNANLQQRISVAWH
jgi:hypothetical protein